MLAGRMTAVRFLGENCTLGHRSLRGTSLSGLFCARGQKFEGTRSGSHCFLLRKDLCLASLLLQPQMRHFQRIKKKSFAQIFHRHHKWSVGKHFLSCVEISRFKFIYLTKKNTYIGRNTSILCIAFAVVPKMPKLSSAFPFASTFLPLTFLRIAFHYSSGLKRAIVISIPFL